MLVDVAESRYDRQERIWWWDQDRLRDSRVLVVGAGALGNEIVKNLVLVGVGRIDIVDMDNIENSNLSRCVFFTAADQGRPKAEVLAGAAGRLNSEVQVTALVNRVQALGSASLLEYDLVIAGLDNREARLWINSACRKFGLYWIDGAIEGLQGLARVFGPEGPCYECTLSEADLANLAHRRSCALLAPEDLDLGRTPTNATTSSIVAGVEAQEAIKLLVGREDLVALSGKVWRLEGETMLTSVIEYTEDANCMAHDRVTVDPIEIRLSELSEWIGSRAIGPDPLLAVDMADDLIHIEECETCGSGLGMLGLRSMIPLGAGRCEHCQSDLPVQSRTSLEPGHPWLGDALRVAQWPAAEIVGARFGDRTEFVVVRGEVH